MKKFLLLYIILFSIALHACTNTLPKSTNIEKPISTESKSVVFMGENIYAPTSHPNVPDAYIPILDDLQLISEVLHKYKILSQEGKVTQDILREYENIRDEIEKMGYISSLNDNIYTLGYALIDLDSDSNPELLLLNHSSRDYSFKHKHFPSIYSIFTIRNGQIKIIEKDSFDLEYNTILSSDGTFYHVKQSGAGYIYTNRFRLEAGSSEFTIISEAWATLIFDSDIPTPSWTKKENGKEINITEIEFNALLEKYENPKDLMKLDFIPLNSDKVVPHAISRPNKASSTITVEYPDSYQGAPNKYKPILDDLYLFSESIRIKGFTDENWGETGFGEYPDGELAYALVDINSDGTLELLLGTIEGLKYAAPNSIFTLKDGKPILLKSLWSRSTGIISADGTIYCRSSAGASYTYLSANKLDKNADTLTQLAEIFSDYSDAEQKPYFVRVVDGKNHYISELEFQSIYEEYTKPSAKIKPTVIPIANCLGFETRAK